MKPFATIDADVAGADPATPENVLEKNIVEAPMHRGGAGGTGYKGEALMLYTSGVAAGARASGSITVEAWALDESVDVANQRRFRLVGVATVITVGAVMPVIDGGGRTVYPAGKIYLRVTAGNAANNKVHAVVA